MSASAYAWAVKVFRARVLAGLNNGDLPWPTDDDEEED